MKALWLLPLLVASGFADEAADRTAVQKAIALFNDPHQRASVVAPDADLPNLKQCYGAEKSQVYFELKSVRFIGPDVALADAAASQYGTFIVKQTMPAFFILKRQRDAWLIDSLRVLENCLRILPLELQP